MSIRRKIGKTRELPNFRVTSDMTTAEREQQIIRVSQQGTHPELNEALANKLRLEVIATVKAVLETALKEEVKVFLNTLIDECAFT